MKIANCSLGILFILFLLSFIEPLYSRPAYLKDVPEPFKKCITCHTTNSGQRLNPFGVDYNRKIENIMEIDSDGDGFPNGEEFKAGTHPGNADSYPKRKTSYSSIIILLLGLTVIVFIAVYFISKKRSIKMRSGSLHQFL